MNSYWKLALELHIGKIATAVALLTAVPAFAATNGAPTTLVVSVEGCGVVQGTCTSVPNGSGTGTGNSSVGGYGDNQAGPLTLFYYTLNSPFGTGVVTPPTALVLPQTGSGANFPVSGEYGSSSEAGIQLSGPGQYLTIMGYGINANTFNANGPSYSAPSNTTPYALAQSGSLTGQGYIPVPRVVTLIDANGNVNSSTALYNIFDNNNPRSTYSIDGTNFYVSGQGNGTDTTGGVFLTTAGAVNNAPTPITGPDSGPTGCTTLSTCNLSQDTRFVQIYNSTLFVSTDSKAGDYNRSYVGTLGDPPATSVFTCTGVGNGCGTGYGPYGPAEIPGLVNTGGTGKYTINTAGSGNNSNGNSLNVGLAVNLSPANFFFASPTVLYVADTGSPKNDSNGPDTVCTNDGGGSKATVGNGGLQKWILNPIVTAGVASGSPTVTAPLSGAFTQGEVGLPISGAGIPAGTTITAVSSAGKTATMSANATATNAGESITVSGWSLSYTLYNGLGLVLNTDCDPANTDGTTGLLGLTGYVSGGVAYLFATNYTIADLDRTYLYGITDTLTTTTMTSPGTAFTVLDTAPPDSNFKGVSFGPTIPAGDVEITSSPSGLAVTSAGTDCAPNTYSTPVTLNWTGAPSCQLSVTSPQSGPAGTQYVFSQWQDSTTGTTDTVTPSTGAVYTATFQTQYLLTTAASPAAGGTVTPSSGFYSASPLSVQATANAGYQFAGFSGGTLSGSTNPQSLTLSGPANVVANFTPLAPNIAASAGARTVISTSSVSMGITLTNTGLGAATNAEIAGISPITVTSGSGTITVASGTGVDLGTIGTGGGQASTTVTFNWPSTATRASFTVNVTADGGYSGSSTITVLR